MLKITATTLSLALLTSTALAADLPVTHAESASEASHLNAGGTIEFNAGYTNFEKNEVELSDNENTSISIDGSYALPVAEQLSLQLDGLATLYLDDLGNSDDATVGEGYLASHFTYRAPQTGLLGVFGGIGLTEDNGDDEDVNKFFSFGGLEGQYYLGDVTLLGQVGYFHATDSYDEAIDAAVFARGGGDFYFTDNTKISADASYVIGNRSGEKTTIFGWGAGAEHKFSSLPVGISASYNGFDLKPLDDSNQPVVHEFRLGAFYQFGTSSVKENDRTAAGLDLPQVARWVSITTNEIE